MSKLLRYCTENSEVQFFGLSSDTLILPVSRGESRISLNGFQVARGGVGVYPFLGRLKQVSTRG